MITWTSRAFGLAGTLAALSACDEGIGLSMPTDEPPAMIKAPMASGKIVLVPPQGYCIDSRSLRKQFALMARCDALTDSAGTGGAPVGVITISLTALEQEQALPEAEEIALATALANPRDIKSADDRLTFRADGPPPQERLSQTHWRGVARVQNFAMGVALYGPAKGRAMTGEGREIIAQLIARTREQSAANES